MKVEALRHVMNAIQLPFYGSKINHALSIAHQLIFKTLKESANLATNPAIHVMQRVKTIALHAMGKDFSIMDTVCLLAQKASMQIL